MSKKKQNRRFIVFVVSVLSVSAVVFNNLTDIIDKMFNPVFDLALYGGFGAITLDVIG